MILITIQQSVHESWRDNKKSGINLQSFEIGSLPSLQNNFDPRAVVNAILKRVKCLGKINFLIKFNTEGEKNFIL